MTARAAKRNVIAAPGGRGITAEARRGIIAFLVLALLGGAGCGPRVEDAAGGAGTDGSPAASGEPAADAARGGARRPALAAQAGTATPHDWPQWGGPHRDFTSDVAGLADGWPDGGPAELWSRPLGEGYSGIVVVDGRLLTLYRDGSDEVVVALDAGTGETLWEHRYGASTRGMNTEYGPGPHASPLVVDGRVFTVGGRGMLHALDATDGRVLWSHDLYEEYGGTFRDRGYSSSPLAFQDTVIVPVGGRGRGVMAFHQADGGVAWQGGSMDNGHSSPVLVEAAGVPQVVAFMAASVAGLDARDGSVLWTHPHPTDYGLNITMPVVEDRTVFLSSAYSGGSRALRLTSGADGPGVEELWFNNRMRVHFGTVVVVDGRAIGSSGDFGPSFLSAIDLATGEVVWRDRSFAKASFVRADGKLVLLDEDGELALVRVGADGPVVLDQASIADSLSWTPPTLAGTRLFVRNRNDVMALELGEAGG